MHTAAFSVPEGLLDFSMEDAKTFFSGPRKPVQPQAWLESSGIKPSPGATATHAKGVLTIVNTPDNVERVASLIDDALHHRPRTAAFTLHTLQAPAAFLRDLAHRTSATADDAAMLAAVEAAVTRGEARFIDTHFLATKPASITTHESIREHAYLSRFGTDAKGQPQLTFAMRPVGSILKLDPVVDTNGRMLQIKLEHELHSAPPEQRREQFRDPASSKPFEMPVVDFHSSRTVTDIPMTSGGTRLISLNRPTSHTEGDVLWATFMKYELVSHLPKVEPPPLEKKKADPADPKAWNTRVYHLPPDFTASGGDTAEGAAMDGNKLVQRFLEGAGALFPEGASVSYTLAANTMIVRNTNENLAIVDAYVESITKLSPKIVACTMHVLQGPGPMLRRIAAQAANKSEHRSEFDEMLAAIKAGSVQSLNTSRIKTKSGTRATARQIVEHASITGVSINDRGEPVFEQKMREVGLRFEFEPTVGADGVTMELTLSPEFHTAEPFEHREHIIDTQGRRLEFPLTDYFTTKLTTGITIPDGSARLLSLYKPTGKPEFEKEDILQAIFITCDLLRAGE